MDLSQTNVYMPVISGSVLSLQRWMYTQQNLGGEEGTTALPQRGGDSMLSKLVRLKKLHALFDFKVNFNSRLLGNENKVEKQLLSASSTFGYIV